MSTSAITPWIRDNQTLRDDVLRRFETDSRLRSNSLPDAIVTNPTLLVDIGKELLYEAVKKDPVDEVVDDLLYAVRRMSLGVANLTPHMAATLSRLRGYRDPSEIEPILVEALDGASDPEKLKLQSSIDFVRRLAISQDDGIAEALPAEELGFSPVDCVACCALSCAICLKLCAICCVAGCLVCG